MKLSAIILAGGNSKRMKYNKELIKIGNEYLVHKQIKALSPYFKEIIVVSNNPDLYQEFDVKVVSDIIDGSTPIIGLHAGLINSSNEYSYVLACDMAFINFRYIEYLKSIIIDHEAYVAKYNNYLEPFNAIYSDKIIPKIVSFLQDGNFGFQSFIKTLNTHYITEQKVSHYMQDMDMFRNINNESDLFNDYKSITSNYHNLEIDKVINNEVIHVIDKVITEYPLSLHINGNHYATLMLTPENIEFLIYGYLYSEMIIKDISEVQSIELNLEDYLCNIEIDHEVVQNLNERLNILSSACGTAKRVITDENNLPFVNNKHPFKLNNILEEVAVFNKKSILFKETGGVHSVELIYGEEKVLFEDIGRHNAVDKVVGYLLKNKIKRDDIYLITSGRISSDILIKIALMNISLIVSRSAPTTLAVKLANKLGVTMVGFARGNKLNIYTNKGRISI